MYYYNITIYYYLILWRPKFPLAIMWFFPLLCW